MRKPGAGAGGRFPTGCGAHGCSGWGRGKLLLSQGRESLLGGTGQHAPHRAIRWLQQPAWALLKGSLFRWLRTGPEAVKGPLFHV